MEVILNGQFILDILSFSKILEFLVIDHFCMKEVSFIIVSDCHYLINDRNLNWIFKYKKRKTLICKFLQSSDYINSTLKSFAYISRPKNKKTKNKNKNWLIEFKSEKKRCYLLRVIIIIKKKFLTSWRFYLQCKIVS